MTVWAYWNLGFNVHPVISYLIKLCFESINTIHIRNLEIDGVSSLTIVFEVSSYVWVKHDKLEVDLV